MVKDRKDYQKIINDTTQLVKKSVLKRSTMTQSELENLRLELAANRYLLAREVLQDASNEASSLEIKLENVTTSEFARLYKEYVSKVDEKGKSVFSKREAESFARNSYKGKGLPYSKIKQEYNQAKDFEKQLFQLLKSIDQVVNALSSVSKQSM